MVNDHFLTRRMHSLPAGGSSFTDRSRAIGSKLAKGCTIALLSLAGLISGHIPSLLHWQTPLVSQLPVVAQPVTPSFTDTDIKNYALAVLLMEPIRQAAYNDIKKIIGSRELPAIACHRKRDIDNLPVDIRGIAINYCNQSRKIVISSGLTIGRFNDITNSLGTDQSLEQRIQAELIRLQKLPPVSVPR